jgi:8-amino-7-oxononanoate synthase
VNFSSNDYLGLANDPRITGALARGIETEGWGSGASPLVTGRGAAHARLESAVADFEQTEAALLFPTGFAANAGTIPALVGRGDAVFSDAKNHASIVDGCRLSGAQVVVYNHTDVDDLRGKLAEAKNLNRKLIVTDGLFSMDGDFAPLDQIAAVASESGAMLMVDEAHATGVIGRHGRGVCEHFQVDAAVSIRVGTFSKALGSQGGFVVGQRRVIEWLRNRARAYVFSTAAPGAVAVAGTAALEIVRAEPRRRETLLRQAAELRDQLRAAGCDVGQSCSQIIPVILGDARRAIMASQQLRQAGMLVPAIRPPSVPAGESLLRISLSYFHTAEMIAQLATALRDSRE